MPRDKELENKLEKVLTEKPKKKARKKKKKSEEVEVEKREYVRVENEKEGVYLPGVYLKDQSNSEYVFQFYTLHPLWMSIVGKFLGDEGRVYSLVVFSLLSIIGLYLLAYEFTSSKYIAFFSGFLGSSSCSC